MTDTNWLKTIFDSWNSKATTTFVLHGNTSDIFLGKTEELSLKNYIVEKAGERGIVLHADPASGVAIETGSHELPGFDPAELRDGPVMENLHRVLLSLANEDKTFAPVDALNKKQAYLQKPLRLEDLEGIKQNRVAQESHGMIEFLPAKQNLDDLDGATTIIDEAIRRHAKGKSAETNTATVQQVLNGFQPPDPIKMEELTEMAVRESSSTDFVPRAFREKYLL